MIEEAIIKLLLESAGLTAIVGDRVYPNIIKDAVYPALFVAVNWGQKLNCDNDLGIKRGEVEVGLMCPDYVDCIDGIGFIRAKLDEFSGQVDNIAIRLQNGEEVPDGYDDETKVHIKSIEYQAIARIKSSN